jgi:integrase
LDFARDIFLFSFYARGMSFVDIAYLRKDDLQNGYISYCRRKTGQRLTIRWEKQMDDIAKKYEKSTVNFMFPIIRHENKNMRNQYKKSRDLVNVHLKEIAVKAGIHIPLSFYAARHSWASIAKEKYIPISVISEGMGHDSETTTQIYLKSLDTNVVDRANRKILDNL